VKTYLEKIMRFIRDEEGATSAEYALVVTLIGLAILVGAGALGIALSGMYTSDASQVAGALSS